MFVEIKDGELVAAKSVTNIRLIINSNGASVELHSYSGFIASTGHISLNDAKQAFKRLKLEVNELCMK